VISDQRLVRTQSKKIDGEIPLGIDEREDQKSKTVQVRESEEPTQGRKPAAYQRSRNIFDANADG